MLLYVFFREKNRALDLFSVVDTANDFVSLLGNFFILVIENSIRFPVSNQAERNDK